VYDEMTLTPLVQVYVKIRLSTHNEIAQDAATMGITMTEYIRDAIEQKVRTRQVIGATEAAQ
jgi:hypothetical protein